MEKKNNNSGCALLIVIVLVLGFLSNYLQEQVSKMSGFANFLLGCLVLGVFYLGYRMNK